MRVYPITTYKNAITFKGFPPRNSHVLNHIPTGIELGPRPVKNFKPSEEDMARLGRLFYNA